MNKTRWIAASAAMLITLFQGCDSRGATAPGDRSGEGKGLVAFRLSPSNATTLRQTSAALKVQVDGPGLTAPVQGLFSLDSMDIVLGGIPCGTRYVKVAAVDVAGRDVWTGADTVEIYPDSTTTAHIVLRRAPTPTGQLKIDLTLDDGLDSTVFSPPVRLPEGPNIGLDSFDVWGIGRMRSASYGFPSGWRAIAAGDLSVGASYFPRPDNAGYVLFSDTGAVLRAQGDSGSEIVSGSMSADWQGTTLAVVMGSDQYPAPSDWDRYITVEDSLGNGVVLRLDARARSGGSDSMVKALGGAYDSANGLVTLSSNGNYTWRPIPWGADSTGVRPADWNPMASLVWYFTWNSNHIEVRSEQGLVGVVSMDAFSGGFKPVRVRIQTVSETGAPVHTSIPRVRLYRGY